MSTASGLPSFGGHQAPMGAQANAGHALQPHRLAAPGIGLHPGGIRPPRPPPPPPPRSQQYAQLISQGLATDASAHLQRGAAAPKEHQRQSGGAADPRAAPDTHPPAAATAAQQSAPEQATDGPGSHSGGERSVTPPESAVGSTSAAHSNGDKPARSSGNPTSEVSSKPSSLEPLPSSYSRAPLADPRLAAARDVGSCGGHAQPASPVPCESHAREAPVDPRKAASRGASSGQPGGATSAVATSRGLRADPGPVAQRLPHTSQQLPQGLLESHQLAQPVPTQAQYQQPLLQHASQLVQGRAFLQSSAQVLRPFPEPYTHPLLRTSQQQLLPAALPGPRPSVFHPGALQQQAPDGGLPGGPPPQGQQSDNLLHPPSAPQPVASIPQGQPPPPPPRPPNCPQPINNQPLQHSGPRMLLPAGFQPHHQFPQQLLEPHQLAQPVPMQAQYQRPLLPHASQLVQGQAFLQSSQSLHSSSAQRFTAMVSHPVHLQQQQPAAVRLQSRPSTLLVGARQHGAAELMGMDFPAPSFHAMGNGQQQQYHHQQLLPLDQQQPGRFGGPPPGPPALDNRPNAGAQFSHPTAHGASGFTHR